MNYSDRQIQIIVAATKLISEKGPSYVLKRKDTVTIKPLKLRTDRKENSTETTQHCNC